MITARLTAATGTAALALSLTACQAGSSVTSSTTTPPAATTSPVAMHTTPLPVSTGSPTTELTPATTTPTVTTAQSRPSPTPAQSGTVCGTVTAANGKQVTAVVDVGPLNCAGVLALFRTYYQQAPTQGQGSSGYLVIDGWTCLSATATSVTVASTCTKGRLAAYTRY